MLKQAVLFALVALTLQASARHIRRSVHDNDVNVYEPEFKVKAPWHGHADEGYPEFDGNPFKRALVEMSAFMASLAAENLEDEKDMPPIIKSIIKGAQKTNWRSFDEYLDYWGAAQNVLVTTLDEEPTKDFQKSWESSRKSKSDETEEDDTELDPRIIID